MNAPLFDDVHAMDRFPYAAAASLFRSPRLQEVFVHRARNLNGWAAFRSTRQGSGF